MTYRDVRVTLTIDGVKYSQRQSIEMEIPVDYVEDRMAHSLGEMFEQHRVRLRPTIFASGKRGIAEPNWYVPVNPILAAFREREFAGNPYALNQWLMFLDDGWDGTICAATPNEVNHARKVLTRLAALTKENYS